MTENLLTQVVATPSPEVPGADPITPAVVTPDPNAGVKQVDGDTDKDAPGDKSKQTGAPEKYEAFKLPEGMEMDTARLEAFSPIAKELGLTQDNAQKLVEFYADAVKTTAEAQHKQWADTQTEWATSSKSDKEFGGAKFAENVSHAKKALEKFGTPELSELAEAYGMGNHPEFIRLLYRVGKAMSEDKMIAASGGGNPPRDAASILYPNQGKQ